MRNVSRFSLMLTVSLLPLLLSWPHTAESVDQKIIVAEKRFVDNGDGTVTDTRRNLMWQKGDNGKEVSFEEAENYCKSLRLGGYADWRLPNPDERDTPLVIELMMRRHSRDVYAFFDLYWSSDPTILLPFNYYPSHGKEISRVYYARKRPKGFVRAVRSLGTDRPDSRG
ncbi:MAG: Lcl C-terminal domain-containing protein [Syntrophales bacterium]